MKRVKCSCGQIVAGATSDELLFAVEAHIDAEHRQREHAHVAPTALAVQHPRKTVAAEAEEER